MASVIVKAAAVPALDNIQFPYQFNESSTLQLINGIANDLQKLLKYFSGTAIFTPSFLLFAPSTTVLSIRFDLYLNDEEFSAVISIKASLFIGCSSLLNYHKLSQVSA